MARGKTFLKLIGKEFRKKLSPLSTEAKWAVVHGGEVSRCRAEALVAARARAGLSSVSPTLRPRPFDGLDGVP
ncbi:hypothetical protein [Streptomyces sp. NPDC019890]|uniref:hypothetical protein n=1 Tax=Streptomyces sp. NPDC019890 TaxID=3365064 RepID=UPI00385115A3